MRSLRNYQKFQDSTPESASKLNFFLFCLSEKHNNSSRHVEMTDSASEDGSWEVEKYRVDYESEEHWELRKVWWIIKIYKTTNFIFVFADFYGDSSWQVLRRRNRLPCSCLHEHRIPWLSVQQRSYGANFSPCPRRRREISPIARRTFEKDFCGSSRGSTEQSAKEMKINLQLSVIFLI